MSDDHPVHEPSCVEIDSASIELVVVGRARDLGGFGVRRETRSFAAGSMLVLRPGADVTIEAVERTRVMIVGGAKLDGSRHIYWNFVSSSKDRIERAKDDWKNGRFPKVPGDEVEFIPLPEV